MERGPLSDTTRILGLPPYQRIVALGPQVIPEILRELEREPDLWFSALERLTGADPVHPRDYGDIKAMARSWLSWAQRNGYRW